MVRPLLACLAVATSVAACTETPDSFPPCVDPNAPCMLDASDGAPADASATDATTSSSEGGDGEASGDGSSPLDGSGGDAGADGSG